MNGPLNIEEAISQILWPDACLGSIRINYDQVVLVIEEYTGITKELICSGYIACSFSEVWDDLILEKATAFHTHEYLDKVLAKLEKRMKGEFWEAGSPDRNRKNWSVLSVNTLDGAELLVVATTYWVRDCQTDK